MIDLSHAEMAALCGELEHSPECVWSGSVQLTIVTEEGGEYPIGVWADGSCTIPYVQPECTCGFDNLLLSAKTKVRAAMESE